METQLRSLLNLQYQFNQKFNFKKFKYSLPFGIINFLSFLIHSSIIKYLNIYFK
jgi:hypothetical protein